MALRDVGPDPTTGKDIGNRDYNDARYALKGDVGIAPESILTQSANTQLTSAVLTALTAGTATKTGTGHTVSTSGITVPAGTYLISNQVKYTNVAARPATLCGVRAVGTTTTDYLTTVMPAAAVTVEATFTITLTESTILRPLVQTTQTTSTNRIVKAADDTRLRALSLAPITVGEPNTQLSADVNALKQLVYNLPASQAGRNTNQSIPSGVDTLLIFNTFPYQLGGAQANSAGVVAPASGYYDLTALLCWPAPATAFSGSRYMIIEQWRSGAMLAQIFTQEFDASIGGVNMGHAVQHWTEMIPLQANDSLRMKALHTASTALNVGPNSNGTMTSHLTLSWRRPLTDI